METKNFVGKDSWKDRFPFPFPSDINELWKDNEVIVLRSILFFHAEEKTTISRIKLHFTEWAIKKLEHDGYIKII